MSGVPSFVGRAVMKKLRGLTLLVLVAALSFAVLAVACGDDDAEADNPAPTEAPTQTPVPTRTPTETPATPTATPTPFDGPVNEIRIPRFDVVSEIEEIGMVPGQNQLDVPKNPHATGWYYIYERPGFGGNAVFSAHVDYYPNIKGPFNRLAEMEEGDEVIVQMANGEEYRYEVFSNVRWHVNEIPMGELIDANDKPDDEEWITLITCGGEFVASSPGGPGQYLHRDVVIARRVS